MSEINIQSHGRNLISLAKILRHYEEALAKANGERFNLFDIIHVGHYEVRTHSPILAELLDPKGSHGQGSVFLVHFLSQLEIYNFEAEVAQIKTEEFIGELGRLDIVIKENKTNRRVIIENKIGARLQDKQLEQYHAKYPEADLLFLTLTGEEPAVEIRKAIGEKLKSISYKKHIIQWLELCRKEAAIVPGVRETITQYIHLIQRLTQQTTNAHMNNELTHEILLNKDAYLAYAYLRDENVVVRRKIIEKLNADVQANLPEGLELKQVLEGNGKKNEAYKFSTWGLDAHKLSFGIVFESRDYGECWFGFEDATRPDKINPNKTIQHAFDAEFSKEFGTCHSTSYWPAWVWMPDHSRAWDDKILAAIQFDKFYEEILLIVKRLKRVADQICRNSNLL